MRERHRGRGLGTRTVPAIRGCRRLTQLQNSRLHASGDDKPDASGAAITASTSKSLTGCPASAYGSDAQQSCPRRPTSHQANGHQPSLQPERLRDRTVISRRSPAAAAVAAAGSKAVGAAPGLSRRHRQRPAHRRRARRSPPHVHHRQSRPARRRHRRQAGRRRLHAAPGHTGWSRRSARSWQPAPAAIPRGVSQPSKSSSYSLHLGTWPMLNAPSPRRRQHPPRRRSTRRCQGCRPHRR